VLVRVETALVVEFEALDEDPEKFKAFVIRGLPRRSLGEAS